MNDQKPTVVLVHGAFAESASWNGVIELLQAQGLDTVAVGNPLRSLTIDAAYVRDVIAGLGRPVVLVGHSYGGMVITEAASNNDAVVALVYVGAFAPDTGESALSLSSKFPGSTLGETLTAYPVSTGGNELAIRADAFHQQFCADVPGRDGRAHGRDPATGHRGLAVRGPADRCPGLEAAPVVVRLRRRRPQHPGRTAALRDRAGRITRNPRAARCLARAQRVGTRRGRGVRARRRRGGPRLILHRPIPNPPA